MTGDILSTREVERILAECYDDNGDVRAILRHDAALRAELHVLRRKVEAVEVIPEGMHVARTYYERDKWMFGRTSASARTEGVKYGATPWEALNVKETE